MQRFSRCLDSRNEHAALLEFWAGNYSLKAGGCKRLGQDSDLVTKDCAGFNGTGVRSNLEVLWCVETAIFNTRRCVASSACPRSG